MLVYITVHNYLCQYFLIVENVILLIMSCTVFTRLNAAAFITFELAEGGGTYSRAAFIRGHCLLFQRGVTVMRPAMVQVVGPVAGLGALEKELQQLPTALSAKYCIYSIKSLLFR